MEQIKVKKKFYKKWWFWTIVVILLIGAIGGNASQGTTKKDDASKPVATNNASSGEKPKEEPKEESKEEPKEETKTRDNSTAVLTTLGAGSFIVGTDIPAGRYVCTGDSSGNFFVYEKEFPVVNEILGGQENLGVSSVTIDLKDGQKIEISGINNVTFTPAETKLLTELSAGTWIVGFDIAPGRYVCASAGGNGNFFVYRNGLPRVNEILGGGEFGVENVTTDLKDGDKVQICGMDKVIFTVK